MKKAFISYLFVGLKLYNLLNNFINNIEFIYKKFSTILHPKNRLFLY